MTMLPIHAPHLPTAWTFPRFARFMSGIALMLDAMADAHAMAVEAHKRYPFAAW